MKILLIDDEALSREAIGDLLTMLGHEVVGVANGKSGLKAFAEGGIELVITDIFMPEKDGLEVIRELKRLDANVHIVAISGGGSRLPEAGDAFLDVAWAMGAEVILHKPIKIQALRESIEAIIEQNSCR